MNLYRHSAGRTRQGGAVLFVAVLLLLLAGILTLLALNVGVFEQRSTANDLRAKLVNEVAEAGLSQGFEYLMRQHGNVLTQGAATWEKCGHTDATFPCGAVSQFELGSNGVATTIQRRSTMYRLKATAHAITDLDAELSRHMLPLASKLATVGNGEKVAYGVAPLLCRVLRPAVSSPPETPIRCGTGAEPEATDLRLVTFVSVARIPGDAARATLVQTIGRYPLLGDLMDKPPITSSGSADVTGGLQVVVNPNAGGAGVPVSVWTRRDIVKTGTTNTCYADEFFRYTANNVTPALFPATCPAGSPGCQTIRCDTCKCDADNTAPQSLSYDSSGNVQVEGIDILDVEGDSTTNGSGTNYNVRSDQYSLAAGIPCEFPPDMFEFVFGVKSWGDNSSPKDCFNETKITKVYTNPNNNTQQVTMGVDEAYLYENASRIIAAAGAPYVYSPGALTSTNLLKPGQALAKASLDATSSGIIWCQNASGNACDIGASAVVGSPGNPVVLVLDGPASIQGTIFGFVFVRDTGTTLNPLTGNSTAGACPSNCMLQMNSGAAVYGALVIQGQMKANGGAAVIFDASVLGNIGKTLPPKFATLPGAWNDQKSY